jgi:hypothetical protein
MIILFIVLAPSLMNLVRRIEGDKLVESLVCSDPVLKWKIALVGWKHPLVVQRALIVNDVVRIGKVEKGGGKKYPGKGGRHVLSEANDR